MLILADVDENIAPEFMTNLVTKGIVFTVAADFMSLLKQQVKKTPMNTKLVAEFLSAQNAAVANSPANDRHDATTDFSIEQNTRRSNENLGNEAPNSELFNVTGPSQSSGNENYDPNLERNNAAGPPGIMIPDINLREVKVETVAEAETQLLPQEPMYDVSIGQGNISSFIVKAEPAWEAELLQQQSEPVAHGLSMMREDSQEQEPNLRLSPGSSYGNMPILGDYGAQQDSRPALLMARETQLTQKTRGTTYAFQKESRQAQLTSGNPQVFQVNLRETPVHPQTLQLTVEPEEAQNAYDVARRGQVASMNLQESRRTAHQRAAQHPKFANCYDSNGRLIIKRKTNDGQTEPPVAKRQKINNISQSTVPENSRSPAVPDGSMRIGHANAMQNLARIHQRKKAEPVKYPSKLESALHEKEHKGISMDRLWEIIYGVEEEMKEQPVHQTKKSRRHKISSNG